MAPVLQAKQLGGIGVDTGEEAEAHTESAKTQSHSQQLPLKVRKVNIKKYIFEF